MMRSASLLPALDGAAVIVCCGSGGVGKTTTAAAIGLESAALGQRAVVVTIDPARRLADALGLPDGLASEPTRIDLAEVGPEVADGGELWAMMLDPAVAFDALVRRHAADEEQVERILSNGFYRNISRTLSGTQEYMAAETLFQLHDDHRFDLVVVDTPPSRNALDFLEASGVLARFLDHRLFRLLMLPARRGMRVVNAATQPLLRAIGKVVGSAVLADAVAFFQAFAGMEAGFRQRADVVIDLLRSDATRYVVVASPHRDTVTEAAWFVGQLVEQGIPRVAGVANRVHPQFGDGTAADAAAAADEAETAGGVGGGGDDGDVGDVERAALWRNVAELRALAEAAEEELAPFAELLGDQPMGEVPLLAGDVHDLSTLAEIRRHLFPVPSEG
ncbi:ArsA family ATPase [soil metagenome]